MNRLPLDRAAEKSKNRIRLFTTRDFRNLVSKRSERCALLIGTNLFFQIIRTDARKRIGPDLCFFEVLTRLPCECEGSKKQTDQAKMREVHDSAEKALRQGKFSSKSTSERGNSLAECCTGKGRYSFMNSQMILRNTSLGVRNSIALRGRSFTSRLISKVCNIPSRIYS